MNQRERPQYGDRIEVRDGDDIWVKAVVDGGVALPGQFRALVNNSFHYLRYDREGTTWRRAE